METVTLKLPEKLLRDAARVASGEDVTVGHLVRVLLAKEVDRRLNPKGPHRADETLVAALQALLARDMAEAQDWEDLAHRLAAHGYALRPAGGGTALFKTYCGTRVCTGSELGFAYRTLVRRFRAAMPGHPHGTLGEVVCRAQPDCKPLGNGEMDRLIDRLGPIFKQAPDWDALIDGLARKKYHLRPMGRGLGLYSSPQGRHVCNTATLGFRYRKLVRRFGAAMPGHPHPAALETPTVDRAAPDFDVIERE